MNDGPALELASVELVEVAIPLIRPFRTSFGEEREKRALLVRVGAGDEEGWGECVAGPEPRYSEEWLDGAWRSLTAILVPLVRAVRSRIRRMWAADWRGSAGIAWRRRPWRRRCSTHGSGFEAAAWVCISARPESEFRAG